MKVVILSGGQGTRLAEETDLVPKPMVEVGGMPLIWHVMKVYERSGFREFVVLLGHKGEYVKRFFVDYVSLSDDLTIRLDDGQISPHRQRRTEDWTIDLIDTGLTTNTGGRLGRAKSFLSERFMLTYGDGVSNVDLPKLLEFHESHGKLATVTAVRPPSRFGSLAFESDGTVRFDEKPHVHEGWINGGFMVFEPEVLAYIKDDTTNLESDVLEVLSEEGQLRAYRHDDFWQCVDTLRDLRYLRSLWDQGERPWLMA